MKPILGDVPDFKTYSEGVICEMASLIWEAFLFGYMYMYRYMEKKAI